MQNLENLWGKKENIHVTNEVMSYLHIDLIQTQSILYVLTLISPNIELDKKVYWKQLICKWHSVSGGMEGEHSSVWKQRDGSKEKGRYVSIVEIKQ